MAGVRELTAAQLPEPLTRRQKPLQCAIRIICATAAPARVDANPYCALSANAISTVFI